MLIAALVFPCEGVGDEPTVFEQPEHEPLDGAHRGVHAIQRSGRTDDRGARDRVGVAAPDASDRWLRLQMCDESEQRRIVERLRGQRPSTGDQPCAEATEVRLVLRDGFRLPEGLVTGEVLVDRRVERLGCLPRGHGIEGSRP